MSYCYQVYNVDFFGLQKDWGIKVVRLPVLLLGAILEWWEETWHFAIENCLLMLIKSIFASQAWMGVVCPVLQIRKGKKKKKQTCERKWGAMNHSENQKNLKDESDFEKCLH